MARLGPRHSSSDNTAGKSKADKARAREDATNVRINAKLRESQRRASGRANNPPA